MVQRVEEAKARGERERLLNRRGDEPDALRGRLPRGRARLLQAPNRARARRVLHDDWPV